MFYWNKSGRPSLVVWLCIGGRIEFDYDQWGTHIFLWHFLWSSFRTMGTYWAWVVTVRNFHVIMTWIFSVLIMVSFFKCHFYQNRPLLAFRVCSLLNDMFAHCASNFLALSKNHSALSYQPFSFWSISWFHYGCKSALLSTIIFWHHNFDFSEDSTQ